MEFRETKSIFVMSRSICTYTVKGVVEIRKKISKMPGYCEKTLSISRIMHRKAVNAKIHTKIVKKSPKQPSAREGDVMVVPASPKRVTHYWPGNHIRQKKENDGKSA